MKVNRCTRCRASGHNAQTCDQVLATDVLLPTRQQRYQRRHRTRGICGLCSRTTVVRRIYDPDTGLVLDDRPLGWCAVHWAAAHRRRTEELNSGSQGGAS